MTDGEEPRWDGGRERQDDESDDTDSPDSTDRPRRRRSETEGERHRSQRRDTRLPRRNALDSRQSSSESRRQRRENRRSSTDTRQRDREQAHAESQQASDALDATRDTEQRGRDSSRGADTDGDTDDSRSPRVSAVDHDATLVSAFEHDGYDCELGRLDETLYGFVRVPGDRDRLKLLWELDVPGEFSYGPDPDGWVGFDTGPVDREVSPREAAMALAGLAAQVNDRSRSAPR
ncbi:MAG: hypothetical protein ABEH80_10830 [Halobaculum sp.]